MTRSPLALALVLALGCDGPGEPPLPSEVPASTVVAEAPPPPPTTEAVADGPATEGMGLLGHGAGSGSGGDSFGEAAPPTGPHPTIHLGIITAGAGLSVDVVRRVVRRHFGEIRACYEPELASAPALSGHAELELAIAADGHVSVASVTNGAFMRTEGAASAPDAAIERCLGAAARTWTFPTPEGVPAVEVSFPMDFSPVHVEPPAAAADGPQGEGIGLGRIGTIGS